MTMDYNQQAARDAHQYLARRVRNDWAFPAVPAPASASDEELHGVAEFRERYYGTTTASATPEPSDAGMPYKFNSPDCVGNTVQAEGERKAQARKRKRRRVLEEEMQWNEGMVCFVRRRDAWTGATSVRKYARRRSRTSAEMPAQDLQALRQVTQILDESAAGKQTDADGDADTNDAGDDNGVGETEEQQLPNNNETETPASEEPLVPIAAPLLANNPIRQSITPRVYSDIYSKIVMASQTPKVPINLSDMTRALVQGWKDDGEWPPRPAPLDPLVGGKRKEVGGTKGAAGTKHGQDFLAQHPHVKRGVDSVKRVFRLSSSGSGVAQEQGTPPIV